MNKGDALCLCKIAWILLGFCNKYVNNEIALWSFIDLSSFYSDTLVHVKNFERHVFVEILKISFIITVFYGFMVIFGHHLKDQRRYLYKFLPFNPAKSDKAGHSFRTTLYEVYGGTVAMLVELTNFMKIQNLFPRINKRIPIHLFRDTTFINQSYQG